VWFNGLEGQRDTKQCVYGSLSFALMSVYQHTVRPRTSTVLTVYSVFIHVHDAMVLLTALTLPTNSTAVSFSVCLSVTLVACDNIVQ